ncbi:MAG TPA: SpoIIE family protein phosphatase [Candidatus Limnocylindria bacterium]|nr:SpoIIE family protein phosphatase [Candidatus Limnocylindria bacterium]
MLRTLFSFRGLINIFGVVALGVPLVLGGQLGNLRTINAINLDLAQIRQGQLAAYGALRLQLDEESGVRGFAATGQPIFLEQYTRARSEIVARLEELRSALEGTNDGDAAVIDDLERVNAQWLRTIAEPIIAHRGAPGLLQRGKELVDRFRTDLVPLEQHLTDRHVAGIVARDTALRKNSLLTTITIALVALEILFFAAAFSRMQQALDRERAVAEALQTAAAGRLVPPQHLRVGSVYRSATRGARVGGDAYDVYRLDEDRTLLVVGDVSGKGLTAAVDTTFIRYALRALASEIAQPELILSRFEGLYRSADAAPEAFTSLFVGIHDRRDGSLTYANAGHEACWIRRGSQLERLAPTGAVVGVSGLGAPPIDAARTTLGKGDLLVLATDGLTEARDRTGRFVAEDEVRRWIIEGDTDYPQRFVDGLMAAVTRFRRGRAGDDLALLAVTPATGTPGAAGSVRRT